MQILILQSSSKLRLIIYSQKRKRKKEFAFCLSFDRNRRILCVLTQAKEMADKPSRSLVLYGDGLARLIGPAHTHLNSFASRACCGFLALPHPPPSENEDARIIREIAELLDASEAYSHVDAKDVSGDEPQENCRFPIVAERFMGMKAAVVTDNLNVKSFVLKLGFTVLHWDEICDSSRSSTDLLPVTSKLLGLLGFQEGKAVDAYQFDLVFVHIGVEEKISDIKDIEFLSCLVGKIDHVAQPGTDVCLRLHMSVIMSYGASLDDDHLNLSVPRANAEHNSELSVVIPRQSYMMKGGKLRENVRQYCPMLVAQYQDAVTRKDMVETFSFQDFSENGGNLVIPADRFIHEVAFKLWKAPKYGA